MRPRTHNRHMPMGASAFFATTLCVLALAWARAASGQEREGGPDEANAIEASPGQGVYLNDSFEAADALRRAKDLAEERSWLEAARLLQATAEKFGERLVKIDEGYYVGIRQHVNDRIASWPAEALRAYRSLYESKAAGYASLIEDNRNIDTLLPIFERYFCTETAARLADTIGQLAIESGNLALARYVYQRAATKHPDSDEHGARWNALLMLLATMRGREAHTADVPEGFSLRWQGQDRPLPAVLEEADEAFRALRQPPSPTDWPIFGGNDTRNRISEIRVEELGVLWRYPLTGSDGGSRRPEHGSGVDTAQPEEGARLIVQPVVAEGLVIIQHHRRVVALHRKTGEVAWAFRADDAPEERIDFLEDRVPGWDAPTIHGGRVYASLPGDAVPYFSYGSSRLPFELVCLDLETGREHWRVNQRAFETRFSEVHFDSSPLVRYGRVYLVGRRRRSFGFEDCYLYRFNAEDGTLQHRTHLGSASTGSFGTRPATRAVAALHGDTVFVGTNLGSIAAVSAHTGGVQWLRLYERSTPAEGLRASRFSVDIDTWKFNPLLFADGRIATRPTDASAVLVLDARDGRILHRIATEVLGGVEQLSGMHDELVCGVGAKAFCYDLAKGQPRWTTDLPDGAELFGRGLWVRSAILIPTRDALTTFDFETGALGETPWREGCGGGNVLALPDQLLVAGAESVCAYVRKAELWAALKARIEASPDDPLPALELAEIALRSEERGDALEALAEAARRVERSAEAPGAPTRTRLFQDAVNFAHTFAERSGLDNATLDRLFTLAAANATSTDAHLTYRIRFAGLFASQDRPEKALQLYQQILRDRTLREATLRRDGGAESASRLATGRIAALIEDHGRALYEPYEGEAAQWLAGARAEKDREGLQRILDTFPNSRAAPEALIADGDLLAATGDADEAARRWTAAYHRYPDHVDRPNLLKRIADAYTSAGRAAQAYRWLTKAAREYPTRRIEHAGRQVTFQEYRGRLEHAREQVAPSRPRIELPLQQGMARSFPGRSSLLAPRFAGDPVSAWSRAYVYTVKGIIAIDPRTGEDLWPEPADVRVSPELLVSTREQALFATPYEVLALDGATGSRLWSHALYPEHLDEFAGDWETGEAFRTHALTDGRLLSVRDNGDMQYLELDTGEMLWTKRHRPAPWGAVALGQGWAGYHIVQDGRVVLLLVDLANGELTDAIETHETRPLENLLATLDHQLILVTSESVAAYDTTTGARRWHAASRGHIRQASLLLDLEALYFSEDGFDLVKIGLEDGQRVWETRDLMRERAEDMTVQRASDSLIVAASTAIAAVDPMSGLTLWRGTSPPQPRFPSRFITDRHVLAVNLPADDREGDNAALFYEHYNATGLIPDDGMVKLGGLDEVRSILAVDDGLLIQADDVIHGWTSE